MTEPAVGPDTLQGLAAKIETLKLTDAEQAVLDDILLRAGLYEPDVEGFGMSIPTTYTGLSSGADLGGGLGLVIGIGSGRVSRPPGWPPTP